MKGILNGFTSGLMLAGIGTFYFSDEVHAIFFMALACYLRIIAQGLKGK